MGDLFVPGATAVEFWQEFVPVHHGCRQLQVLVKFQTVRLSTNENSKVYHISLSCEDDHNFLYKTTVTADTYERLVRYERLATPFAQFPNFVQQLIHAVCSSHAQQEAGTSGERLLVNILSRSGDDGALREIEFLVTARQIGCIVQAKRLSLSFTLASDTDFKEHLGNAFHNIMAPFTDETEFNFWRLVWCSRPSIVVLLCNAQGTTGAEKKDNSTLCSHFWAHVRKEKSFEDGRLRVRTEGLDQGQDCDYYDISMTMTGHRLPLHLRLIHYRQWDNDDDVPSSLMNFQKEKQQLEMRVRSLETQRDGQNVKIRDLEQSRVWQERQLLIMQNMLQSSQNIQRHYESLLREQKMSVGHQSNKSLSTSKTLVLPDRSISTSPGDVGQDFPSPICSESSQVQELWSNQTIASSLSHDKSKKTETNFTFRCSKRPLEQQQSTEEIIRVEEGKEVNIEEIVSQTLDESSISVKQEELDEIQMNEEPIITQSQSMMPTSSALLDSLLSSPNTSQSGPLTPPFDSSFLNGPLAGNDLPPATPISGIGTYFHCLICNSTTVPGQESMKTHFLAKHVRSGRCPICPVESAVEDRADLLNHMLSHTTRVYVCQFCGKQGRIHYLKIHVRSHTGEKPYKCRLCGRGFADASTFRRHQRVHTGEKPYQCPICGRQIARKDNVKVHIRSHMKDGPLSGFSSDANVASLNDSIMSSTSSFTSLSDRMSSSQ